MITIYLIRLIPFINFLFLFFLIILQDLYIFQDLQPHSLKFHQQR